MTKQSHRGNIKEHVYLTSGQVKTKHITWTRNFKIQLDYGDLIIKTDTNRLASVDMSIRGKVSQCQESEKEKDSTRVLQSLCVVGDIQME